MYTVSPQGRFDALLPHFHQSPLKTGDHNIQNPQLNLATCIRHTQISGLCSTGNGTAKGFLTIQLKSQFLVVKTKHDANCLFLNTCQIALNTNINCTKKKLGCYSAATTLIRNKPSWQYPVVHSNWPRNFWPVGHTNDVQPSGCLHVWQSGGRKRKLVKIKDDLIHCYQNSQLFFSTCLQCCVVERH